MIVHYLRLSFWPSPLVIDYYDWPVARTAATVVPAGALVVALLVATMWALRYRPSVGFLGGWFFLILAPTSSVLPLIGEFAAERRMYLPLAAVIALVVIGWHMVFGGICRRLGWESGRRRIVEVVVVVAMVATLAQLTVRRNEDYRSEVSLWTDVVAKRPNNARGHYNLGVALATQGKLDEAIAHYSEALRIRPNSPRAHNNLGVALATQGRLDEAIAHYPRRYGSHPLRTRTTTWATRWPRKASSMKRSRNIPRRSGSTPTMRKRTTTWAMRWPRKASSMRRSPIIPRRSGLSPILPEAHDNLGDALATQGKLDEAIAQYSEALRIKPDYAEAHNNLGMRWPGKASSMRRSPIIPRRSGSSPDYAGAHNNLGNALAGKGSSTKRSRSIPRRCESTPNSRQAHNDLGNALSAARQAR